MDYLIRQLRKSHHKSDENGRETTKEVSKSRRKLWYRRVFCFGNCGAKNKPLLNESYEDICLPELSKANVTPIVYTDGSSGNADLEIKKEDRIVQVRSTLEHTMEDITPPLAPNKTASKTETDVDENISLSLPPPFPKGRSKSMRTKHSEDFREEYSMAINNGWKNASFRSNKNNDEYFLPLNTNLNKPTKEINVEEELAISCFQPVHICRNNSMPRKLNENLKGGHIAIRDEPGNVDICSENKCKQYLPPNTNIRDTATWVDVNATHPAVSEIQKSNMGIFYSSFQSIPNTNLAVLPKNPNANPPLFMNEKYGSVILNGITANGVVDILEISQNANIPNEILLCHSQNLTTELLAIDQDYKSLAHCHFTLIKEGNDDSETKETNVSQALINYKSYGSRSENIGSGSASEECGGVFLIEQCIPLKPSQAIHLNESYILTSKDGDIVPTEGKCDQVVLPIHNGYYQNRTESVENRFGVGDSSEGLLVPPDPNLQIPTAAKGDVGMTHFVKFTFPQIPTQDNIVSTIGSDESVTLQHNGNNRAKTEGVDRGMVAGNLNEEFLLPCDLNFEKHLLVIDLDETLIHSSFEEIPNADFVVPVEINGIISQVYVAKRPYVDEFLQKMKPLYDCVLFTASQAKYADPVIDLLDKSGVFNARLFREACVLYRGYYVKDLSKFGRSLERIIIIDNSPACYYFHPENAVSVRSWFNDTTDTELLDLIPFFERLANIKNVYDVLPISKRRFNMTPHL